MSIDIDALPPNVTLLDILNQTNLSEVDREKAISYCNTSDEALRTEIIDYFDVSKPNEQDENTNIDFSILQAIILLNDTQRLQHYFTDVNNKAWLQPDSVMQKKIKSDYISQALATALKLKHYDCLDVFLNESMLGKKDLYHYWNYSNLLSIPFLNILVVLAVGFEWLGKLVYRLFQLGVTDKQSDQNSEFVLTYHIVHLLIKACHENLSEEFDYLITWRPKGLWNRFREFIGIAPPFAAFLASQALLKKVLGGITSLAMLNKIRNIELPASWITRNPFNNSASASKTIDGILSEYRGPIFREIFEAEVAENKTETLSLLLEIPSAKLIAENITFDSALDHRADQSLLVLLEKQAYPRTNVSGYRGYPSGNLTIKAIVNNPYSPCNKILFHYKNNLGLLLESLRQLASVDQIESWIDIVNDEFGSLLNLEPSIPLSNEEAQQGFYFIAHLLRVNTISANNQIKRLLKIPAIAAIARDTISLNRPDELLQIARKFNNIDMIDVFNALPEKFIQENSNTTYLNSIKTYDQLKNEIRVAFGQSSSNTLGLSTHAETSMEELSRDESQQLAAFKTTYLPKLKTAGGIEAVLTTLRKALADAYHEAPAIFEGAPLPLNWQDWEKSSLFNNNKAVKAYYQHPIHTAWRYLQRPNPWYSKETPHAQELSSPPDPNNRTGLYNQYQELVALLWLGAQDTSVNLIDPEGLKIDPQIQIEDHFWMALHELNRAHNLKKRPILDKNGEPLRDPKTQKVLYKEIYDNKPDAASCRPGTKRRLFHSLPYHPLLKRVISADSIKQALHESVRSYYTEWLQSASFETKRQIADELYTYLVDLDEKPLEKYNIPTEKLEWFKEDLIAKWGERLRELITNVWMRCLKSPALKVHVVGFNSLLERILPTPRAATESLPSLSETGFFNERSDDIEQLDVYDNESERILY